MSSRCASQAMRASAPLPAFDDSIAKSAETGGQEVAHGRFVFDNQQGLMAPASPGAGTATASDAWFGTGWKEHAESAALAWKALDLDPALVLLGDAIDSGKAKAGSLADIFGSKERFENANEGGLVHALACVRHAQAYKRANPRVAMLAEILLIDQEQRRGNPEMPAFGHGITGVDCQVDNHLFDHAGICLDPGRIRGIVHFENNMLTKQAAKHF